MESVSIEFRILLLAAMSSTKDRFEAVIPMLRWTHDGKRRIRSYRNRIDVVRNALSSILKTRVATGVEHFSIISVWSGPI